MYILQITPIVIPGDGVGRTALARLAGLDRAGHRVELVTSHLAAPLPTGVAAHIIPVEHCYRDSDWPAPVLRAIGEADAVIWDYSGGHSLVRILNRHRPRRLAVNYYGLTSPELIGDPNYTQDYLLAVRRLRKVADCDLLITHSEFSRREFEGLCGRAPDRAAVIPLFGSSAPALAPNAWNPGAPIRLLCVGRLYPNKNYEVAIHAAVRLRRRGVPVELRHVGGGSDAVSERYRRRLSELIGALGASAYVSLAGRVSEDELARAYADCHAVIVPSLHEGFALPVVEALAHGRPVLAANMGALPETLGDAGLLFDPFDPDDLAARITELFGPDPEPREALAPRAARRSADLSVRAFQDRTNAALTELCANPLSVGTVSDPFPALEPLQVSWHCADGLLPDARGTVRVLNARALIDPTFRLTASVTDADGGVAVFHTPLSQSWQPDGPDWTIAFTLAGLPDAADGRLVLALRCEMNGEWHSVGRPWSVGLREVRTRAPAPPRAVAWSERLTALVSGLTPETRYPERQVLSWFQRLQLPVANRLLDLMYTFLVPRAEVQELFNQSLLSTQRGRPKPYHPEQLSGTDNPPDVK